MDRLANSNPEAYAYRFAESYIEEEGLQVFSLSGMRKIKEEGVYFSSHIDGKKIFI